jgi:ABC-2 type transport system permease protein
MRWHRLLAVARKEVIQILRDSRSLGIVVAMPVVLMLLFGYGVTVDLKHAPTCVFDREGSQASQDLLKRFQASEYFRIAAVLDNYPALLAGLDSGGCKLALVVPPDFSRQLSSRGTAQVQALVDATDDNSANLIFGYSEAVVASFSQQVQLDWLAQRGQSQAQVPLAIEGRTWFNEDLESRNFVIPGVIALVMAVIGAFLTSLTIAREWERGTMEQLISTPVTPLEVMLGKLAPYFVVGMLDTALCTALAIELFQVPFRGSFALLFAGSALFLIVVLSLGFVFSVVGKNQLAASQLALVATFLPAFLLSGFLFSIEQMPLAVQTITRVVPARYFVSLLKGLFLKGTPAPLLMPEFCALGLFALLLGLMATRAFRKQLT